MASWRYHVSDGSRKSRVGANSQVAKDIAAAVSEALEEYGDEACEAIKIAGRATAKEAAKRIRKSKPGFDGRDYLSGWTSTQKENMRYKVSFAVYNNRKPGLAHLLEFGHAKAGGGRNGQSRTTAYPHIAPIDNEVPDIMVKYLKELLE